MEADVQDARVVVDAQTARTPADALLGKYAVHTRFYGRERTTGFVDLLHEIIVIADITRDSSGLQMRVETCEDSGYLLTAGLRTDVRVAFPEKFPVRSFGLAVEGSSFHTTGEALPVGFTRDWPSTCSAGTRIPSTATWTQGSCECVPGTEPPSRVDDCRVIDSDQDGNPGMTVQGSGLVNAAQSVRILDRSQYVFG
ncbi:MAG TPA: hypothetical protein VFX59_19710 [Polyangiales bacterium]|nr:hypothetical protein [Polyangiales bacterium]